MLAYEMDTSTSGKSLFGREQELQSMKEHLDRVLNGEGRTVLVSGEPGIGKSVFIGEVSKRAMEGGFRVLKGTSVQDIMQPYRVFSRALESLTTRPLFEELEQVGFAQILVIDKSGLLVAKASPEGDDLDADIFAGMLTAVQSFVRDSFDAAGTSEAGLGRLEYGNMKILIEHGRDLFITAVLKGKEHPDMARVLNRTVQDIETEHGKLLENWDGMMEEVAPIRKSITDLASVRFIVKRSLEDVRLEAERFKIADNVLGLLSSASELSPLLLVLEDLHWIDESSIFVLQYLARNLGGRRILIFGAARQGEEEIFDTSLEAMRQEGLLREIVLGKMTDDSLSEMVSREFSPNRFPSAFTEHLIDECQGNPFFVKELLRQMVAEGSVSVVDGEYVLSRDEYSMPSSIEEIVHHRLDLLPPDAVAMAEFASCIGRNFNISEAGTIGTLGDPQAALDTLVEAGIITIDDGGAGFAHGLFHSFIYDQVAPRWKTTYHRSLGEYYEKAYDENLDMVAYELARHFSRTRENSKTVKYGIMAGEMAESSFAPEQAISFYNIASEAMKHGATGSQAWQMSDISERLGNLQALLGDYDVAITNYNQAQELASENENKARAHRKIGALLTIQGEYDLAMEHLGMGMELIKGGQGAEMGRNLNVLSEVYKEMGQYDRSIELNKEALDIFHNASSREQDTAHCLSLIGKGYRQKGDYSRALEYYERALEITREQGILREQAALYTNIGNIYGDRGDNPRCLENYERGLEIFEKLGDVRAISVVSNNMGILLTDLGEYRQALENLGKSLEIYQKIGDVRLMTSTMSNIGNVHYFQGDYQAALDQYLKAMEMQQARLGNLPVSGPALINIGCMYFELGELEKAREYLEKTIELADELGSKGLLLAGLTTMADVKLASGDVAEAKELATKSLEISSKAGIIDSEGESLRLLGMVSSNEGDTEAMHGFFQRAISELSAEGMNASQAEARTSYGKALEKVGEKDKAREQLEGARQLFGSVKMEHKVRETDEVLARLA